MTSNWETTKQRPSTKSIEAGIVNIHFLPHYLFGNKWHASADGGDTVATSLGAGKNLDVHGCSDIDMDTGVGLRYTRKLQSFLNWLSTSGWPIRFLPIGSIHNWVNEGMRIKL